ncbi:MAG TPA: ABC transporter ATP-binding protein [Ktedonobacteraceae bacterium]|nr:ABC transporter ATP-binding protein [Ktedonobacteraceae bacterium]
MDRNDATVDEDIVLAVKDISVDYEAENGSVHAVSDVNISLRRGQILGVAGESGSGKSTLAYTIARLLQPPAVVTKGEVMYYPRVRELAEGQRTDARKAQLKVPVDILQLSPADLHALRWNEIAMVFQSAMNALNPVLTIGEQIDDVLRTHRPAMKLASRKQRAYELLELVGIAADRLHSYPHELSGGMRQRAIIAIALALNPEILILDEPTTALDVVMQREILTEVIRLHEQMGFSIIFITHDLSLLLEVADQVVIMYAGRIIEAATRREMYLHPRHPYSYGLLHSFPSLRGPRRRMVGVPGSPPDLRRPPAGCAFHPRCPLAFAPCSVELPQLLPFTQDEAVSEHTSMPTRVACHLYDPHHRASAPAQSDLAAAYEALSTKKVATL